MHCVRCLLSFQVDIIVLASKYQDTYILMVQIFSRKHTHFVPKINAAKIAIFFTTVVLRPNWVYSPWLSISNLIMILFHDILLSSGIELRSSEKKVDHPQRTSAFFIILKGQTFKRWAGALVYWLQEETCVPKVLGSNPGFIH